MIFETINGEKYELDCEVTHLCKGKDHYTLLEFTDKKFIEEKQKTELFEYIKKVGRKL